jgi:hypothetical protein
MINNHLQVADFRVESGYIAFGYREFVMIWIVLLLILAALLFGSSAIFGAIGVVLGFIAAASALGVASFTFQLEPGAIMILGVLGFFIIVGLVIVITAVRQS